VRGATRFGCYKATISTGMATTSRNECAMAYNLVDALVARDDDGGMITEIRCSDGYVNATKMCQSAGKRWNDYWVNGSTKSFIQELTKSTGILVELLITQTITGPNMQRGTWVHQEIAIDLARWCSPKFAVAVARLVRRYLMGQVTTEESREVARRAGFAMAEPPALPPPQMQVHYMVTALEKLGIDLQNPRWSQGLRDLSMNILGMSPNPALPSPTPEERWAGVVEIAEEMGYRNAVKLDVRTALGRHVSNRHDWECDTAELKRRKEERLCNGTMRKIWVYLDTPTFRELISEYFADD
jgi:hypothetical protein